MLLGILLNEGLDRFFSHGFSVYFLCFHVTEPHLSRIPWEQEELAAERFPR